MPELQALFEILVGIQPDLMLVLDAVNSGTYSMYHHLHLKKSASCKARFAYSIDIPKTYSLGKTIYFFYELCQEGTKKLFLIEWVAWVMVKGVLGTPLQDHPIPAMKSQ